MLDAWMARLDRWQRTRAWTAFPFGVIKKFGDDQAGNLAALVAYYSFFSIFPLLLVLTTVLGRVLADDPDLQAKVLDSALVQLPVIGDQIRDDVDGLPGSGLVLVLGLLGAVWAGMGAVLAMQTALDGVWNVPLRRRPNLLVGRLRALAVLGLLGTGVVVLTLSAPLARSVADVPVLGSLASVVVAFLLALGLFLATFHLLTDAPVAWRDQLPGAAVAALAWAGLQLVGAAFVRHWVEGAQGAAGVFAVVIGLLSWLYLQAQLTVLAAEINVVRREHLWPRSLTGRELGDGDRRALARYAAVEKRVEGQDLVVELRPPAVDRFVRTPAAADESG